MIRYPGSKEKIVRHIVSRFPYAIMLGGLFQRAELEYREPFFGAGAIGWQVFRKLSAHNRIWINDRDPGLRRLWGAVYSAPDELIAKVRGFTPSVEAFELFKQSDGRASEDPVESGFRKLALHQISFSGLGVKAGGPIGGRQQSSAYNVNCRWNPSRLCAEIKRQHTELQRFREVRITALDFAALIDEAPASAFIYADPPYIAKGPKLYKFSMQEQDHQRLATALRRCAAPWVLSYDEHPLMRELYQSWARIQTVHLTYTTAVANGNRRKNAEVVISPRD
jgi:DNA adenine methylase